MGVKEMPAAERPRERLLWLGPEALSNQELLAILLRTGGRPGENAMGLAGRLMTRFGNLPRLLDASAEELAQEPGLGPAKAATILGAMELGRRLAATPRQWGESISSPSDVAQLLMEEMRHLDREFFRAVLVGTKNQILEVRTISVGTLSASMVHPREVFKPCIRRSTASIILVHNHPSGDPSPSREDIEVTQRLAEAGKLLGIEVLDHIIIGDRRFVSLRERGLIIAR